MEIFGTYLKLSLLNEMFCKLNEKSNKIKINFQNIRK